MSKAVEPDQVETPDELSITFQPASITAHFDALDAKIDELVNVYSKGSQSERDDVYELLVKLYPTETSRLNNIKNPPETR